MALSQLFQLCIRKLTIKIELPNNQDRIAKALYQFLSDLDPCIRCFADSNLLATKLWYIKGDDSVITLRIDASTYVYDENNDICDVIVSLFVNDISEYQIVGTNRYSRRLSGGVYILIDGDQIGIDFDDTADDPLTMDDIRKSKAYAIGKSISYEIQEVS